MKAQTMRRLRQIHLYIGMFFAPMLLLFALSGALQTFRLNEPRGWGGTPPAWMQWVAAIHKNQAPPRAQAPGGDRHDDRKPERKAAPVGAPVPSPLPLKVLTVLMAIGLFATTVIGMVIALNTRAYRTGSIVSLVLGTVLPIVLLKL